MTQSFDEKFMKTILEMIEHLKDSKLWSIGLTVCPKGEDWEFELRKVLDKFSQEHPYCKRLCDNCGYGTHSQCDQPEKCHDTDDKKDWVDLD